MATYTITTATNFENLTSPAGDDTYNINGTTLTIDSDTRYCSNHSALTGVLGNIAISSTLGGVLNIDGTKVRLIPYTSGSGTVPAYGTAITEGDVSSTLLGVWSAINTVPTAVGASMPATGFLKVKNKTGGNYSAGALSGIEATASGADVTGWIEIAGVETKTLTVPRLGTVNITGDWFYAGTTSGEANQSIQLPASVNNTFYAGVGIETEVADEYEFYPCVGSSATDIATDARGKVCWITAAGVLTISGNGTNTRGFLPPAERKIRVPNIVFVNTNSAGGFAANQVPHATLTSRYSFVTTTAGSINIDKAHFAWRLYFQQPYTLNIANASIQDYLYFEKCATRALITNVGIGITQAQSNTAFSTTSCPNGATITKCVFTRYDLASSGNYVINIASSSDFTFTNCKMISLAATRGHSTTATAYLYQSSALTLTDCGVIGGRVNVVTVAGCTITRLSHADSITGTTGSTNPQAAIDASTRSSDIIIDGFGCLCGISNIGPYNPVISLSGCTNVYIKNIGTIAAPLNLNSISEYMVRSYGNCNNVRIKRVYSINQRTNVFNFLNTDNGVLIENFWGDTASNPSLEMLNGQIKGIRCTPSNAQKSSIYGTHFYDCFTSTTAGRIGLLCNEKTLLVPSVNTYSIAAGNPSFTSNTQVAMPSVGDEIIWTMQYYAIGHTGLANTAPTITMSGTASYVTFYYKIDKNDGAGFNATWRTFDAATLSAETGISSVNGFKLKIRAVANTAATNTAVTSIVVYTTTTEEAQKEQYPIDKIYGTLNVSGIVAGSDVVLLSAGTTTVLAEVDQNASNIYSYTYEYVENTKIDIGVLKAGKVPFYIREYLLTSAEVTLPVEQVDDRSYV